MDISHVRLIKVAAMKLQSLLKSGRPMEEARNACAVQMVQAAKVIVVSTFHLSYRQPAQNGVLTEQLCRAIYCIHLSIMPMQIAITIT